MDQDVRNIAVLGSTGSIGRSTLEVVNSSNGRLQVVGLTAHSRLHELCRQATRFQPACIVASDADRADSFNWSEKPDSAELFTGAAGISSLATRPEVDIVVAAIVGSAGLTGTWAALDAGKTVALANKETLVMAGPQVMELAEQRQAKILPVDSEHSAVFQAIDAGRRSDVRRIVLTASGGPFRRHTADQLARVTVDDALAHPTWNMGRKISVDSATMMNKALEIIEARWLFDLAPEQIDVVVHPQSIVHSFVEFRDGSVIGQLSPPDMKLPIQYALTYPERWDCPSPSLDFASAMSLDFEPPDLDRFPALTLGHEVARAGGTAGAVLNAANEAAVAEFLEGRIAFNEIVPACRTVLDHHEFNNRPTLEELIELDQWARREVTRWVCT